MMEPRNRGTEEPFARDAQRAKRKKKQVSQGENRDLITQLAVSGVSLSAQAGGRAAVSQKGGSRSDNSDDSCRRDLIYDSSVTINDESLF